MGHTQLHTTIKGIIPILISLFVLSACDSSKKDKSDGTYLGGEIINPKWSYILLQKNDKIVDTIPLDAHNRFFYEFTDFDPGLYWFWHRENQLIHIEPGDSIMLRVNTLEFDESLSFSGKGSERSGFLIDLFLQWEEENEGFIHHYQKEPKDFQTLLDSIHQIRIQKLRK